MKFYNRNIICSDDSQQNILEVDDRFYQIEPIAEDITKTKGHNSCVFNLFDSNEEQYFIIKFCRFYLSEHNDDYIKQRIDRFYREIRALQKAVDNNLNNIIHFEFSGIEKINNRRFLYYVMEKGECDLTNYQKENEIPEDQKILLCLQITKGIEQLHSIDIYHRDIKPDNIFFVNDEWKIGDLGLSDFRQKEKKLDFLNEKIGPYGWLSPEVMNKALCEGSDLEQIHNCKIADYSDIFQLGKLFWYIFQGNVPIGQIVNTDFLTNDNDLFNLISGMLQYSFKRRPPMNKLIDDLKTINNKYP